MRLTNYGHKYLSRQIRFYSSYDKNYIKQFENGCIFFYNENGCIETKNYSSFKDPKTSFPRNIASSPTYNIYLGI